MTVVVDALDVGSSAWYSEDRCATWVMSSDTIRCVCADVTGYIAVLAAPRFVYRDHSQVRFHISTVAKISAVYSLKLVQGRIQSLSLGGQSPCRAPLPSPPLPHSFPPSLLPSPIPFRPSPPFPFPPLPLKVRGSSPGKL